MMIVNKLIDVISTINNEICNVQRENYMEAYFNIQREQLIKKMAQTVLSEN